MICYPCKAAGKKTKLARKIRETAAARSLYPESDADAAEAVRITLAQAEAMHAECDWPDNCPCQHRTLTPESV